MSRSFLKVVVLAGGVSIVLVAFFVQSREKSAPKTSTNDHPLEIDQRDRIERLEKELNHVKKYQLFERQDARAKVETDPSMELRPEQPDPKPMTEEERRQYESRVASQLLTAHENQWRAESADAEWSASRTGELLTQFGTTPLNEYLEEVECRATRCSVRLRPSPHQLEDVFAAARPQHGAFGHTNEDGSIIMFLGREGYEFSPGDSHDIARVQ